MKIHSIIILLIAIIEIASHSHGNRKIRCCGKNYFPSIFKKLSRQSSKTAPVKRANIVLLSQTANHSPSNWLSGTKPSKISLLNHFYVDPYYESVRAKKPRLSGLIDYSPDVVSENAYAKWEHRIDLFMVENSHPSSPSSIKTKRRKPQVKSNKFRRVTSVAYAPNDPHLIALELLKLIPPETLKYPNDCYADPRQQYQPECAGYQYDLPVVPAIEPLLANPESTEYQHGEESEEKIQNYKIFLSLEKVDQIPGYSQFL